MELRWRSAFFPSMKIRTLMLLWATSVFLVWAALVVGWFVARQDLSALGRRVQTEVAALDTTRILESDVLSHRRENFLWQATGLETHRERRDADMLRALQAAGKLDGFAATPDDWALSREIHARLDVLRSQSLLPGPSANAREAQTANAMLVDETQSVDELLDILGRVQVRQEKLA